MIEKKHLMIGNLVTLAHESNTPIVAVSQIRATGVFVDRSDIYANEYHSFEMLLPIVLTPEWLEKCEFKRSGTKGYRYEHDECSDYILVSNGIYMTNIAPEIKSLHQLQNIFYWKTGKELTFKSDNNVAL